MHNPRQAQGAPCLLLPASSGGFICTKKCHDLIFFPSTVLQVKKLFMSLCLFLWDRKQKYQTVLFIISY